MPGWRGRACWSGAAATRRWTGWRAIRRATSTAAVPPAPSRAPPTAPSPPGTTPAVPGRPRLVGTGYFALGGAESEGKEFLRRYYRFVGPFAERIADGLLTSPEAIAELAAGYAEAGCDELVLFPTVAAIEQLELLAEIVKGAGA